MGNILRGDIYYADLSPVVGSEQGGMRPVVVIQNDIGNKYSPTVIVLPLTSQIKKYMPTHLNVNKDSGLFMDSTVEGEQIRTIDKSRLKRYIGTFPRDVMTEINKIVAISLALSLSTA